MCSNGDWYGIKNDMTKTSEIIAKSLFSVFNNYFFFFSEMLPEQIGGN